MKVFMLGWEFPPHITGGLGTACYGLTKGLDEIGVEVSFVLPTAVPPETTSHVKLRTPSELGAASAAQSRCSPPEGFEHVRLHRVSAAIQPYARPAPPDSPIIREQMALQAQPDPGAPDIALLLPAELIDGAASSNYKGDLMGQIQRYARLAVELAGLESFDVVHAHDWMTFPAGLATAAASGRPLVVHIHSTEFDRAGLNVDQRVYDIERMSMQAAAKVVCVSVLTKSIVTSRYGVPPEKIEVVYNAVDLPTSAQWQVKPIRRNEKIVLFLGRLTMQKGPEYFLRAARKVVDKFPNVRFVLAGSGDMIASCIHEAADLRLGRHVTFTGFLRGPDVDRVFEMADLYVMPSVSEPFGIAPLEALSHNVPVIISKQSGVSEVLTHVLKVDFWDIDEMANKILAVLTHPPLQKTLRQHGHIELRKLSWTDSARQLSAIYEQVTGAAKGRSGRDAGAPAGDST